MHWAGKRGPTHFVIARGHEDFGEGVDRQAADLAHRHHAGLTLYIQNRGGCVGRIVKPDDVMKS